MLPGKCATHSIARHNNQMRPCCNGVSVRKIVDFCSFQAYLCLRDDFTGKPKCADVRSGVLGATVSMGPCLGWGVGGLYHMGPNCWLTACSPALAWEKGVCAMIETYRCVCIYDTPNFLNKKFPNKKMSPLAEVLKNVGIEDVARRLGRLS